MIGWVLETIFGTWKRRKFINRGLMNGPWCPIYGVSAILISFMAPDLVRRPFFLFLASAVIASFIEFITGQLLEKIFHKKLWDYSHFRYHAGGYVSLTSAVMWGAFGMVGLWGIQPLLRGAYVSLPQFVRMGIILTLLFLLAIDCFCTFSIFFHYQRDYEGLEGVNRGLRRVTDRIGRGIGSFVMGRMERNFTDAHMKEAELKIQEKAAAEAVTENAVFASGCGFYKLTLLFMIGAFLGDIIETIFCLITTGVIMSRSSVVFGPFSVVWGIGIVILTAALYKFRHKEDRYIILAGTLLGGVYEYLCSVFTERIFGTVFWDYSGIPFNLGGRINLLYCFFWGIAALAWLKLGYPFFSKWIERLPIMAGKIITWFLVVFMIVNMAVSVAALIRYNERSQGALPENEWEQLIDTYFYDSKMDRIYPNAIMK